MYHKMICINMKKPLILPEMIDINMFNQAVERYGVASQINKIYSIFDQNNDVCDRILNDEERNTIYKEMRLRKI